MNEDEGTTIRGQRCLDMGSGPKQIHEKLIATLGDDACELS
jgi:hypothetical protein